MNDLPDLPSLTAERLAEMEARAARERAAEEAEAEAKRRRSLVDRGVPMKDLERAVSGDLVATPAVAEAREAIACGIVLLVLSGRRGCGKTTAAAWWVAQERPRSKLLTLSPPRFVEASALARWDRYSEEKMREIERASALVVDDLGVEYDDKAGAFRSFLDGVVNARYAHCLPTLITTNLPATEFKARYGERVADRIRESGRFVELAGDSLRGGAPTDVRAIDQRPGGRHATESR